MKKQLSPGMTAVVIVLVLAVLGIITWRIFGPEPPPQDTPEARAAAQRLVEGIKSQGRAARQASSGAPALPQASAPTGR